MKKLLVIVDMQNDFIVGTLANTEGQKIVSKIADYTKRFQGDVIATQDTHDNDYLTTQEGQNLPVPHCIKKSYGWDIVPEIRQVLDERMDNRNILNDVQTQTIVKPTFGSTQLGQLIADRGYTDVEICGVCTDICVISNALLIKTFSPEAKITVHKDLCAGVTPESHETALKAMQACQINII